MEVATVPINNHKTTQIILAIPNLTGLTQPNISQYMNGTKTPSFFTVDKIARALNCSTDDFRCIF